MIFVNFKLYGQSFGEGAIRLAEICKRVGEKYKISIYPVVQALDAVRIMKEVGIPVVLQNCDEWWEGARTGWTSAEAAKELGIWGSLINHSEHKTKPGSIKKMLKHWPEGFKSIVCIHSWGQAERWAKNIKPDLVAYEPTYLIGSKDKSVSTEKPDMIKKLAEHYQPIPLLAGAGVHNTEDVRVAKTLGAKGILVASDVVKADNPEKELAELAGGFSV